ncbi:hypothetical protein E2C01_002829 [Portunus trituberculatus]|uniref:Uncharacterized protein n=1 Tax=Portunus trituberculatus TaxID=210409 RepID=A0A5B7CM99_PORTR|nr:hypothetical protein [Portunus trituberculatus]
METHKLTAPITKITVTRMKRLMATETPGCGPGGGSVVMVVEGELSVETGVGGGSVVWPGSGVFVVLSCGVVVMVVVVVVVGAGVVVSGSGVVVVVVVVVVISVGGFVGGGVVMGRVVSGISVCGGVVTVVGFGVVDITGSSVGVVSFSSCGAGLVTGGIFVVSFCRTVMVVAAGSAAEGVGCVALVAFCCGRVCAARGVASRQVARSTTTWLIKGMPGTSTPVCKGGNQITHIAKDTYW